jgi:hypothetical protein
LLIRRRGLLFPLALIWFPEEIGNLTGYFQTGYVNVQTPGIIISLRTYSLYAMNPLDFSWMVGKHIKVSFSEPSMWLFSFGDSLGISVECPWRLLERGRIVIRPMPRKSRRPCSSF